MFMSEYDLHRLQVGAPARLMVEGSVRKLNSEVASIAPRSSEIDPALVEPNKLKGLNALRTTTLWICRLPTRTAG